MSTVTKRFMRDQVNWPPNRLVLDSRFSHLPNGRVCIYMMYWNVLTGYSGIAVGILVAGNKISIRDY